MPAQRWIRPHLLDLEPYDPPEPAAAAARAGIALDELVRLDANENTLGPSPRVGPALAARGDYAYYPDYRPLRRALADYAGAAPGQVVLGNGADELIDLLMRLLLDPGQGVVICPPAFGMYRFFARVNRRPLLEAPRRPDWSLDLDGIEALAEGTTQARLLFLTSPGNPDGQMIPLESIERLLRLPLVVVVDEAYVEFGGPSARPLLEAHDNLVVLRTLSKWAGLAGLRLGYALLDAGLATYLERIRPPYNVNMAALAAALAVLQDLGTARARVERLVANRERLLGALREIPWIEPLPSQANFILCRLRGCTGAELAAELAGRGILVRCFAEERLRDYLRISVGRPDQNEALLRALRSTTRILHGLHGAGHGLCTDNRDCTGPCRGSLPAFAGTGFVAARSDTTASVPRDCGPVATGRGEARLALTKRPIYGTGGPMQTRNGVTIERRTAETEVRVRLALDGRGEHSIETGVGFMDHLLVQLAVHGLFDLEVRAQGDLQVDAHHTVEDVAIVLGQALDRALGQRRGLARLGQAYAPMDESLARVVVDLSGRPYSVVQVEWRDPRLGTMDSDLVVHFLETLAVHGRLNLHAQVLYGRSDHHKAEALFKALGRALDMAVQLDPRRVGVPSSKGVLE